MIGYSERSAGRIKAEKRVLGDAPFTAPQKRYCMSRLSIDPDEFDREAIRCKIYQVYGQRENLVFNKLLVFHLVVCMPFYVCACVSFQVILQGDGQEDYLEPGVEGDGVSYKRVNNKRYYYEQPSII